MDDQQVKALRDEFRARYWSLVDDISAVVHRQDDVNLLARLGDRLDDYTSLFSQHGASFEEEEREMLQQNLLRMRADIQLQFRNSSEHIHQGFRPVVQHVRTGQRGRPRVSIDPDFLREAYTISSTQRIAAFLGVGRTVVREHLLELGLVDPQVNPFVENSDGITSYTRRVFAVTNEELDGFIREIRERHSSQGINMLRGTLLSMGLVVSEQRIRQSMRRLEPRRVFTRAAVERRTYNVSGPNALWHHDGQHGLIRWGIVIHGFIDGYSRLITGLRASDNNRGETVLQLFFDAARVYKVPVRLRGDHGVENLLVAAWMEQFRGPGQGGYIWGRSVHNIRIERLWVDVTIQVGNKWADRFRRLEQRCGLDINEPRHIWLLHSLFLKEINKDLDEFTDTWNHHTIRMRDSRNRSPRDMFFFDMVACGERGDALPDDATDHGVGSSSESIEFRNDNLNLFTEREDGGQLGHVLLGVDQGSVINGVHLDPPDRPREEEEVLSDLWEHLLGVSIEPHENVIETTWFEALAFLSGR